MQNEASYIDLLTLQTTVSEAVALNDFPKAFKGIPIALITVDILSIAFMGFAGIA